MKSNILKKADGTLLFPINCNNWRCDNVLTCPNALNCFTLFSSSQCCEYLSCRDCSNCINWLSRCNPNGYVNLGGK